MDVEAILLNAIGVAIREAESITPTPMMVAQHTNPLDDHSPVDKAWYVSEGVCGFGYVLVPDARKRVTKELIKTGHFRYSEYNKAASMSAGTWTQSQSYERNVKFATTVCRELREHGIECYVESRLD
jgi:hypothetical protein